MAGRPPFLAGTLSASLGRVRPLHRGTVLALCCGKIKRKFRGLSLIRLVPQRFRRSTLDCGTADLDKCSRGDIMPYRVNVRGADVTVDSLEELDALLERFV